MAVAVPASMEHAELAFSSSDGKNKTLSRVLFGLVLFCSGQR
jgi:hypothetical protein